MICLGPYTLLRRLGTGGMGEVWIARRSALGGAAKLVAIKTVLPEKARNPESRRMFLDEARLSMLMTNSNIVQVFDVDETRDGVCYMAMEYVEGIDLARLCEHLSAAGQQLSHAAIAYIIGEILKALAYAHDLNVEGTRRTIVHRDISPQNVMVSVSGEVKVMDFGIARFSSEETSGLFVKGKIRYMPPEQFEKGVRAPTLDLFAVGAILHELLEGKRFRGGDYEQAELLGVCLRGDVPPLTCPPGRVPPVFEQLRAGLLQPIAANRIQSAREAHRLLSRWPGDRDAKFELEEVVQRFVGDSSLVTATVASRAQVAMAATVAKFDPAGVPVTATTRAAVPSAENEPETPISNDELTDLRRNGEVSDTTAEIVASVSARIYPRSARGKWIAGAFACLSTFGLVALSQSEQPASEDSTEYSQSVLQSSIPPTPVAPQVAAEPTPIVEPEPEPEPEPESKRTAKTTVSLTAGGVWAQVKIGRRQYTLDRLKGAKRINAKLEPGDYVVSFRNDPKAAWQPLGKVRIPTRGPITLDIRDGKFTLGK